MMAQYDSEYFTLYLRDGLMGLYTTPDHADYLLFDLLYAGDLHQQLEHGHRQSAVEVMGQFNNITMLLNTVVLIRFTYFMLDEL